MYIAGYALCVVQSMRVVHVRRSRCAQQNVLWALLLLQGLLKEQYQAREAVHQA